MTDLITRFIVAVETIATALTALSTGSAVPTPAATDKPAGEAAAPKPSGRGKAANAAKTDNAAAPAADTSAADAAAAKAAQEAADKAAADKAAADKAAADKAAAKEEPGFDYEKLKKAIIDLASAGEEGKDAAVRILTDAGLEKGQKASDAPKAKWEGMHKQAVAALAKINEASSFA